MAGDEPSSPRISATVPRPPNCVATYSPMVRPIFSLSAPMNAVYLPELVLRSKRITGMPLSYARSIGFVTVFIWFGETISRSTSPSVSALICSVCCLSLSSAETKRSSTLSCRYVASRSSPLSFSRQLSSLHCETPMTYVFLLLEQARMRDNKNAQNKAPPNLPIRGGT